MEGMLQGRDRRLSQLVQKRGITTKVAVLYEDRLEIRTSTFLGEVRSALELDSVEAISHVRGAGTGLTVAAAASLLATLAWGVTILMGGAVPADSQMLLTLGGLSLVLVLLVALVRQDTFRIETYRKGGYTLFADRDPDTAVVEFLGAVRRARQRIMSGPRDSSPEHSIAEEIRKLSGLVGDNVLTPEEFLQKKRELLELELAAEYAGELDFFEDPTEDDKPRSIN